MAIVNGSSSLDRILHSWIFFSYYVITLVRYCCFKQLISALQGSSQFAKWSATFFLYHLHWNQHVWGPDISKIPKTTWCNCNHLQQCECQISFSWYTFHQQDPHTYPTPSLLLCIILQSKAKMVVPTCASVQKITDHSDSSEIIWIVLGECSSTSAMRRVIYLFSTLPHPLVFCNISQLSALCSEQMWDCWRERTK